MIMRYRKEKDNAGPYLGKNGERFSIYAIRRIRTGQGVNVGYEEFATLEEALESWNLMHESAVTQISVGNENSSEEKEIRQPND